jgi:hypothetical protein
MSWQSEAVWPVTLLVSSSLGWLMHLLLDLFLH